MSTTTVHNLGFNTNITQERKARGVTGDIFRARREAAILIACQTLAEKWLSAVHRRAEYYVLWESPREFRLFVVTDMQGLHELVPPSNPLNIPPEDDPDGEFSGADTARAAHLMGNFHYEFGEGFFVSNATHAEDGVVELIEHLMVLSGKSYPTTTWTQIALNKRPHEVISKTYQLQLPTEVVAAQSSQPIDSPEVLSRCIEAFIDQCPNLNLVGRVDLRGLLERLAKPNADGMIDPPAETPANENQEKDA